MHDPVITIPGRPIGGFCDSRSGAARRHFLRIGGLALGGLPMGRIMAARAAAPAAVPSGGLGHKAVIMVYLPGGPSHQDSFDLKTEAPAEIRGSFRPIGTNVPGIEICEHLPREHVLAVAGDQERQHDEAVGVAFDRERGGIAGAGRHAVLSAVSLAPDVKTGSVSAG